MANEKKGKVVQMLSPENYIRQRARTLPISECRVNKEWKESGLADVLVARRHTNNNRTFGLFLVDLKCLGVKDATWRFNIPESEYQEFLYLMDKNMDSINIPYPLAHNIVLAGIEFAEEYGFKPHKDFTSVAQYILEEDTDDVELIEIDCGHNGKPLYIHGPSESDARTRQIIAQLDRTAGPGNYTIIDEADWDQELDEDDEDDEDEWVDELDEEIQLNLQTKSPGLQFKVQIEGIYNPPVWRRLIVPSHYSFRLFHEIIQNTFNWWSEHLYAFSPGGWNSSPQIMEIDEEEDDLGMGKKMESTETPLSEYFNKKGEKFHYIYDFGDNWDHLITLEKILEEEISQPCCTGGEGLCPPENCGGIPGYENLKIALANPAHPEHEELKDWLGLDEEETWDPADFELEEVQELLADLFTLDPKPNLNNN